MEWIVEAETLSDFVDYGRYTIHTKPLIRCKDCKYYNAGFECLVEGYGIERDKDWYCADAERRTNERMDV